jgi:hypothetical protein
MSLITHVKIRAFRSSDEPETCQRFIEGHLKVLENIGVKKVTSAKNDWVNNQNSYTIIVESLEEDKVYGGARLQIADGVTPLPLEEATGYMDKNVTEIVKKQMQFGTAELCGLWNSREVAGLGVGAFFATKAGVVIAEQLSLKSIFALCAPITVKFANKVGCTICKDIGNQGTFYYPKLDLVATIVLLNDTEKLTDAEPEVRKSILYLRKNLQSNVTEKVPKRDVHLKIDYDLRIDKLKRS